MHSMFEEGLNAGFVERPVLNRFLQYVKAEENGCLLWTGGASKTPIGYYGAFWLNGRKEKSHRASYQFCFGPIPPKFLICHKCDVPLCVNPHHLFLGTPADNLRDMISKGRGKFQFRQGQDVPAAKLTNEQVLAIADRIDAGDLFADIGADYGITMGAISNIHRGVTWGGVTGFDRMERKPIKRGRLTRVSRLLAEIERLKIENQKLKTEIAAFHEAACERAGEMCQSDRFVVAMDEFAAAVSP